MDVFNGESKNWAQSTVLSSGMQPGTFLLGAQDVGYMDDVPAVALREAAVHGDTLIGSTLRKGERVEYLDQIAGGWNPCCRSGQWHKAGQLRRRGARRREDVWHQRHAVAAGRQAPRR